MGISAQGKADRRAATPWVPPMSRVLKVSRPVRAERRDRGNAPSTHTSGLSEDGMRWWNDEHMGITPPRPTRADCRKMACIGGTMSTWELCTHVMRPIYARSTQTDGLSENGMHWWNDEHMGIMHPCNAPNLRPLCRGALPLFRHIALTGRDTF